MYLVKSCKKKYNPLVSQTLRVGSLSEYREIEEDQVVDKEEGFFRIKFDLKKKWIKTDLFNHLNFSHNSDFSARNISLNLMGSDQGYMFIDYTGEYEWANKNRFIFCISKINAHEDSTSIFPDYDDYWFVSLFRQQSIREEMAKSLFSVVKDKIRSGEKLFDHDIDDLSLLEIKSYSQDIAYGHRDLYLGNSDIDRMTDFLVSIFDNIKFIKPERFSPEKEVRFVFDFYYKGILIHPLVKSLVIPSTNINRLISSA